jgi:hypothetical protein
MTDSIKGGYRTPAIRLKFNPDFKWKAARNDAVAAKGAESNVCFKIHFILDISQDNYSSQTRLRIVPKDIMLVNKSNKYEFWKETLK